MTQAVEGTVVTFIDITEQNEMQLRLQHYMDELEQSNATLEQFARVASHDLRAPLRAIHHLVKWVGEDDADGLSNTSRRDLAQALRRVESTEALLENLLQHSILPQQPAIVEAIDSGVLVNDLLLLLEIPPQVSIEVTPDMPTLDAPKAPFMLVFRNMLSYAIKSQPRPDCRLIISGEVSEDAAVFTVSDDSADQALDGRERLALLSGASAAFDNAVNQDEGMAFARRTAERYGGSLQLSQAAGKERALILTWPTRPAS